MATSWKSQTGNGTYRLQFETDDIEKYKLVEKSAQMAVDGKTTADAVEVKHGEWKRRSRSKAERRCAEMKPYQIKFIHHIITSITIIVCTYLVMKYGF